MKHTDKVVSASKKSADRFVACVNIDALQQLNLGSLWIRIADDKGNEKDVTLFGASLNAWTGSSQEELYIIDNGKETTIPASTKIVGFYEQRDLGPQWDGIWNEKRAEQAARAAKNKANG